MRLARSNFSRGLVKALKVFIGAIFICVAAIFINAMVAATQALSSTAAPKSSVISVASFGQEVKRTIAGVARIPTQLLQDLKLSQLHRNGTLPRLDIELGLKELQKLERRRQEALAMGLLVTESDSFVPAWLSSGKTRVRAKIRLKGDFLDHLRTHKWSMRLKVLDDAALFGMRSFSLQDPDTRGYQVEPLIQEFFKKEGLLGLRWNVVDLYINGRRIGIMYMEEHMSKELLEAQDRTEGVILGFDDSRAMNTWLLRIARTRLMQREARPIPDIQEVAPFSIKVFQENTILRNPKLKAQARMAVGLLRGYLDGDLAPAEVFKLPELSKFFAAATIWQAFHPFGHNNIRLYFDPVVQLFEPVLYDAAALDYVPPGPHIAAGPALDSLIRFAAITLWPFTDRAFFERYEKDLHRLSAVIISGETREWLEPLESQILLKLQPDYGYQEPTTFGALFSNARLFAQHTVTPAQDLERRPREKLPVKVSNLAELANPIEALLLEDDRGFYLDLQNLTSSRLIVESIYHPESKTELVNSIPQTIEPWGIDQPYRFPLPGVLVQEDALFEVEVKDSRSNSRAKIFSNLSFPKLQERPFQASEQFSFITKTGDLVFDIKPGVWQVQKDISLPEGAKLNMAPGTTLQFGEGVRLIVRGPLLAFGEKLSPVTFEALTPDLGWGGLIVMQKDAGESVLQHAHFSGISMGGKGKTDQWPLTGGVTLTGGSFEISNSSFSKTLREDALNIVRADFNISHTIFSNNSSDALDIDFGKGTIRLSTFVNTGGDAVDLSGSDVNASEIVITNARDKGISIGENSTVTINQATISLAGTGIACKDGSFCNVKKSTFQNVKHNWLMSYRKKMEYGPAKMHVMNLQDHRLKSCCVVQHDSSLAINGKKIATSALNVHELYDSGYMQK